MAGVVPHAVARRASRRQLGASDVGLIISRQNGKGTVLEVRELGGLFVLGEELIIHTAHEFKTAA